MTEAPVVMPLHMRRERFDPVEDLARLRDGDAVSWVETGLGVSAYLVTRYEDVRMVLSDTSRFSNADRRSFALAGDRECGAGRAAVRSAAGL